MEKLKFLSIFTIRDLRIFWFGLLLFSLADSIYNVSLNWWILEELQSEFELGVVGMFNFLPLFLFGLFSGVIIDLFNRKRLLVIAAIIRGLAIFLIPLLNYFSLLEIWILYIIAFLQGISLTFVRISIGAIIPDLVQKEDLMTANSVVDISFWIAAIFGYFTGGMLVDPIGEMPLLVLTTFLLITSSIIFIFIHSMPSKNQEVISIRKVFDDLFEGLKIVKNDYVIFILIATWMGIQVLFAAGPMTIGWPVFSQKILNAGPQGYGMLIVAVSISSIIGNFLIGQWGRKMRKGNMIMIGFLWGSLGIFLLTLTNDLITALIIAFLWNFCYPLINVPYFTIIQERSPEKELGKVYGVSNTIAAAMNPISILVTGTIMERISIVFPFQLFALALFTCFVIVFLTKDLRKIQ